MADTTIEFKIPPKTIHDNRNYLGMTDGGKVSVTPQEQTIASTYWAENKNPTDEEGK